MAEERMLNDEILLGLIKANSGGGGGGTSDYEQLENLPKINGVTLTGNKSASDLSLASADDLAGKQDALTAGQYIQMQGNEISVKRDISKVDTAVNYVCNTVGIGSFTVKKYVDGEQVGSTIQYEYNTIVGAQNIDDVFTVAYTSTTGNWVITNTVASNEHPAGYEKTMFRSLPAEYSQTFVVVLDADKKLIIQSELDAALSSKQDTLTFDDVPTANSNNPVKSGGVKSAIDAAVSSAYHHAGTKTCVELVAGLLVAGNEGNVYNMTDSGTTTADFIEGAGQPIKAGDNVGVAKISDGVYKFDLLSGFVDTSNFVQKSATAGLLKNDGTVNDEIEGDVATLKSGLINFDADIDAPNKKNFLQNNATSATQPSGITYTVHDDGSVTAEGEATENSNFTLNYPFTREGNYILSGCPSGGSTTGYSLEAFLSSSKYVKDTGNGANVTVGSGESWRIRITIASGTVIPEGGITFYPMLRLSIVSDATYAPYIPSVESRIEAVESGLDAVKSRLIASSQSTGTTQSKLNYLYTLWQGLTDDEKRRAYLFAGENTKYSLTNKYYRIFNNTAYSGSDASLLSRTVELKSNTSTSTVVEIKDTGTTITDKSLDETATIWYLYV